MEKTNECTGECCARFTLSRGAKGRLLTSQDRKQRVFAEGLEYLGANNPHHGSDMNFTCKYWDKETRLCTIYEDRSRVCSEFPYAGKCGVCGMVGPKAKDPSTAPIVWCCTTHQEQYEGVLP